MWEGLGVVESGVTGVVCVNHMKGGYHPNLVLARILGYGSNMIPCRSLLLCIWHSRFGSKW